MGQPCAVVVSKGRQKDLRLMLEASKGIGIDNAIPVSLKLRANRTGFFIGSSPGTRCSSRHMETGTLSPMPLSPRVWTLRCRMMASLRSPTGAFFQTPLRPNIQGQQSIELRAERSSLYMAQEKRSVKAYSGPAQPAADDVSLSPKALLPLYFASDYALSLCNISGPW